MLYLIRHAHSQANENPLICRTIPDRDVDLSERGLGELPGLVRQLSTALSPVRGAIFYSSPFKRSLETVNFVQVQAPWATLKVDEDIAEINFGAIKGLTNQEWAVRFSDNWNEYVAVKDKPTLRLGFRYPKGESGLDVCARIGRFLESIPADGRDVFVFSHDLPLKAMHCYLRGESPEAIYCIPDFPHAQAIRPRPPLELAP